MTNIAEWYEATVDGASVNAVAQKAGLVQTTLSRQVKSGQFSPETVVAVAVAYGRDVLDALVVAGLITRDQIRDHGVRVTLAEVADAEIAAEVMRRMGGGILDAPLS